MACESQFAEHLRMLSCFPLSLALLCFPTVAILFASVGFLLGVPCHGGYGVVAIVLCALGCFYGGGSRRVGLKRAGWFIGSILVVWAVDSCFVMFSWWDAQAYHIPATQFLLEGWNPVFDATREELLAALNLNPESFNAYHVAYLPRAGWVFGAITATLTGNIESGDTLILFTALTLAAVAFRSAPTLFQCSRGLSFFFATLVMLAPGVVASAFCGAQDGSLYSLLMINLLSGCMYRKTGDWHWLSYIIPSIIIGSNLKFTGAVSACIACAVFTIPVAWLASRGLRAKSTLWMWVGAHAVAFFFAGLVGFSPYLTNWANYGGPFYPQHSFNKEIVLPAMTEDFNLINDDAAEMGYFGRLTNAYLSKWAAHRYYEWKLNKKPFNPVFHLDQVGGLGAPFRVIMLLTLLIAVFTRKCSTPWLLAAIVITSFAQPARFVGYVRYVPQLWMLPVLIGFNAITRNLSTRSACCALAGRSLGLITVSALATSTYVYCLMKVVLALATSIYTQSLIDALKDEPTPRAYVLSLHDRYRQDGRSMAAWSLLPPDIPSPHLFEVYYHMLFKEFEIDHVQWQTPRDMEALLQNDEPRFYIGEHLWVWPQDPGRVRIPTAHFYIGHPKKRLEPHDYWTLFRAIVKNFPAHLASVVPERFEQFHNNYTREDPCTIK